MRFPIAIMPALLIAAIGQAADYRLTFTTIERTLPTVKTIAVVKAGEPGPGSPKFKAVAETAKYKEAIKLPDEGPYDIWWQARDGIAVKVVGGIKLQDGANKEIK